MRKETRNRSRTPSSDFLFSLLMAVLAWALAGAAAASTISVGPGLSGQIHALAYDPDNPGTVYAGGDNCGLYISHDDGGTWQLFSNGLENTDFTRSYYVDDILVLGEQSGLPSQYQGVYAATHGGIYFLPRGSTTWQLRTDYRINPVWYSDQLALPEVAFYRNDAENSAGCRCMSDSPSAVYLNKDTPDVETEITQTAESTYHYKVTWRGRCCYPLCTYEYEVGNTINGLSATSSLQQFKTSKICAGNPPQN